MPNPSQPQSCGSDPGEDWQPSFPRQEIWVFNTEYRLFSEKGPRVTLEALHRCRLDECAKCLGASSADAAVRLFWADGVVSVDGPELGKWLRVCGRTSPSEQGMAWVLLPNIEAAWRGEWKTRTLAEGKADCETHGFKKAEYRDPCFRYDQPVEPKQPSPGIYVWRSVARAEEEWNWKADAPSEGSWEEIEGSWRGYGGNLPWPTEPTVESATHFLKAYRNQNAVGVLLAYEGAVLDFVSTRPLAPAVKGAPGFEPPEVCITVLGGPKGITPTFASALKAVFQEASLPLVEVCLGPEEEMAHACVAFLRLQDDAGKYRAAVTDLLRLGREGYDCRAARMRQVFESVARESPRRSRSPHRQQESSGGSVLT